MLSATVNTLRPHFNSTFLSPHPNLTLPLHPPLLHKPSPKPISATYTPPSNSQQQLYQPFRPPPSTPLPSKFNALDVDRRLEILANRLGLWYEYAPLIPSLMREGFNPSSIEESTGISGVEQNRLVVAAQVRDSLLQSSTDPELVSSFDTGGAELLYEIRLLSALQRAAAARYIVEHRFDAQGAQELARAIKDFPRRRGDKGWESFDFNLPGDCLSFMYYRQSREHKNASEQRTAALEQALKVAETEKARSRVLEELEGTSDKKESIEGDTDNVVRVPVVRLRLGEVAEASSVFVLPVCRAEESEREVLEAPREYRSEGEFGVVVAEKGWERWVVLPAWEPLIGLGKGGVVVAFRDAKALPWKANRWYREEAILVVADRGRKAVAADDSFYLVAGGGDGGDLKVERGLALKEMGVEESLGTVVLVVRPPREETDDQLADEDWE
ncbi:hypothetical protein FH972_006329 [Carpinus fangiana]|uniref:Rubisco accumulation factor 1 C-terminal domain-containing protein n=1 Tax=Carpinus fangiana TaxID=176857 RepID=A0A5N6QSA4_9ROSI|nr:hypothetical protein FH972_006329 [Carpinus fangiana]